MDGQSPHVPNRIERAGEGAAPEGLAISRKLLSAVAGRIAGAYFNAAVRPFRHRVRDLGVPIAAGPAPQEGRRASSRTCGLARGLVVRARASNGSGHGILRTAQSKEEYVASRG